MESSSLGSIQIEGTSVRLAGTSSQLDTGGLVQSLVEAKKIPALRLENKITVNETRIAAYQDVRTILGDLQTAAKGLRNELGFLGASENIFQQKLAFFSSDTATPPGDLLSVRVDNNAAVGSFDVTVEQTARVRKFASAAASDAQLDLATSINGGTAFTGAFSIGLEGGDRVTFDVEGTDSLADLKARINAESEATGVSANILQVADDAFRLVFTADEPGKEVVLADEGDPGIFPFPGDDDVLDILGLSADGGTTFANGLQDPQLARITIDGLTVERNTNSIDDVIDGVTLDLFRAEAGTTITVDIERDLAAVKEQVTAFLDSYNAFRDLVVQNREVNADGTVSENAPLFGDTLLRNMEQSLADDMTLAIPGLPNDAIGTLGAVGIVMVEGGRLIMDEQTFDDALLDDADAVRRIFEFDFRSSSADLDIFARGDRIADTEFSIAITDADDDGIAESVTIDGIAAEVDGNTIRGAAGTDYEGLEFLWYGNGSDTIDVTLSQGIADRLYNRLDGLTDTLTGTIENEIDGLEELNDGFRDQITRIEERAEDYRLRLIEQFSAMETALSLAEAMMDQIGAVTGALQGDR